MRKLFVLDTSVLLFDHHSLQSFQEHDIVIPIIVLEELDNFKLGNESKNFEARSAIRVIDKLFSNKGLNKWTKLEGGLGRIKVFFSEKKPRVDASTIYGSEKNDHKILNQVKLISESSKDTVVTLVTKDINLRIKARALGILSEDYLTGKVENLEEITTSSNNVENLDSKIIRDLYLKKSIEENGILQDLKMANGYYILNNCSESVLARYDEAKKSLELVNKQYIFGVKPKNAEQTFAVNALLNTNIRLVALEGVAGTGKTLLALAAALEQKNNYQQIILSRPIVPLSNRDIGFLPGDAEDKISPYMQPLWDNLKFIKSQFKGTDRKSKLIEELLENNDIQITALTFIRGRSLIKTMFIIDEAQNLTPHEIKTIITRAGEGTKIVFTGDIHQIDTPYLDEQSNGLSYIIDRLKGNKLFAHVKLEKGERSELANLANQLL